MSLSVAADPRWEGNLPINFLPAALPVLQGQTQGLVPVYLKPEGGGISRVRIAASDLAAGLAAMAPSFGLTPFIGPIDTHAPAAEGNIGVIEPLVSPPEPSENTGRRGGQGVTHIGVIDTGFAFWNKRFAGDQNFTAIGYLPMDRAFAEGDILAQGDLAALAARAENEGELVLFSELGRLFPQSLWAGTQGAPLLTPDRFSHGTSMAALAAEGRQMGAGLFGLELPQLAVTDSSGDILQGVLSLAIHAMINMVLGQTAPGRLGNKDKLVIVLPFAFLGGPHGVGHGLAGQIEAVIDDLPQRLRDDIKIVVPMGNHREDRAHGLSNAQTGPLNLRLLPDDHSSNSVELVFAGAPTLTLRSPRGEEVDINLHPGVHLLKFGQDVIGALWCAGPGAGGLARARLTFAPTASRDSADRLCSAGLWRLAFDSTDDVKAWILRDQRFFFGPGAMPYRQARFEDGDYVQKINVHQVPADEPNSSVRRAGTASVLAAAGAGQPALVAATAEWSHNITAVTGAPAPYAGVFDGDPAAGLGGPVQLETALVDTPRPYGGRQVVGNGTGRLFRVSGTSVAAAMVGARLAGATPD